MKKKNKTDKLNYYDEMMTFKHLREDVYDIQEIVQTLDSDSFEKDEIFDHRVSLNKLRIEHFNNPKMLEIIDYIESTLNSYFDNLDTLRSFLSSIELDFQDLVYDHVDEKKSPILKPTFQKYVEHFQKFHNCYTSDFEDFIHYTNKYNINLEDNEHLHFRNRSDKFDHVKEYNDMMKDDDEV